MNKNQIKRDQIRRLLELGLAGRMSRKNSDKIQNPFQKSLYGNKNQGERNIQAVRSRSLKQYTLSDKKKTNEIKMNIKNELREMRQGKNNKEYGKDQSKKLKKTAIKDKVFDLVKERKKHYEKFKAQEKEIIKNNGLLQNQNKIVSVTSLISCDDLSMHSKDSDIDKQVNFILPEKPIKKKQQKHKIHEQNKLFLQWDGVNLEKATNLQIFTEQLSIEPKDNTPLGILFEFLQTYMREELLNMLEVDDEIVTVKYFKGSDRRELRMLHSYPAVRLEKIINGYRLVLEKCLAILNKGYKNINNLKADQIFNTFVSVPCEELKLEAADTWIKLLLIYSNNLNSKIYLRSKSGEYIQIQNISLSKDFSIQTKMKKIYSYQQVLFFFQSIFIIKQVRKVFANSLSLKHYQNHFCVLSAKIFETGVIYVSCSSQQKSKTNLIVLKLVNNNNIQIVSHGVNELDFRAEASQYEIYVNNEEGDIVDIIIKGRSNVKIQLKHRQEYRNYTHKIISTYLEKQKTDAIDIRMYSQPAIIRYNLFICLATDILVNPLSQDIIINLKYRNYVLCDLQYKKNQITIKLAPKSVYYIALKKLEQVQIKCMRAGNETEILIFQGIQYIC